MARITYYSGTTELGYVFGLKNSSFAAIGGVRNKHNRYGSFQCLAGKTLDGLATMPVTRVIEFKSNPSLHKCDGRCLHAKGHVCECSCGGKNHGAGG